MQEDTIAAIATPNGVGGIGIIRLSGPKAETIGRVLFRPRKESATFQNHHLYYGDVISPGTGMVIDEALLTVMRKPHSYTGEDIVEIHCHGGSLILQAVLNEIIQAGARLAHHGEFTKRAFLNNRLDLSQAEAVIDLIMAKTRRGMDLALSQLKGKLFDKIESLKLSLIDILAHLETAIDFIEEDIDFLSYRELSEKIQNIIIDIETIISSYSEGKLYRDGMTVVITGRPNVGKSSLLNRMLGEERAIVTSIPGTTRDFIEEAVNIRGIPIRLIDTAGIRDSDDTIEREGIKFVWQKLASADIIIVLIDGSKDLTEEDMEIVESNKDRKVLVVLNKSDLPHRNIPEKLDKLLPGTETIRISAKYGNGIPELKEMIYFLVTEETDDSGNEVIISNLRHKTALEKAQLLLSKAKENIVGELSPEFAAFDIRESLEHLDDIVGKTTNKAILDKIFSDFCIGK